MNTIFCIISVIILGAIGLLTVIGEQVLCFIEKRSEVVKRFFESLPMEEEDEKQS